MREPMSRHHCILQIMPADGWWAVWADDSMTPIYIRERVISFALVEFWLSRDTLSFRCDRERGDEPDDRMIVPVTRMEDATEIIDPRDVSNFVGCWHQDEWTEENIVAIVEAYYERKKVM
jgi:hypothetical protein